MSVLQVAQERRDVMHRRCGLAAGYIAAGNVDKALSLIEGALGRLAGVKDFYGPDAAALDAVIGVASVAAEVTKWPAHGEHRTRATELLHKAVRMRLYTVTGRGMTSA